MDGRTYFATQEEISAIRTLEEADRFRPKLMERFRGDPSLQELLHSLAIQKDGIRELEARAARD